MLGIYSWRLGIVLQQRTMRCNVDSLYNNIKNVNNNNHDLLSRLAARVDMYVAPLQSIQYRDSLSKCHERGPVGFFR